MTRLSIEGYAILLAIAASRRSEDPYCKVGCVAFNKTNQVVATGYNGLASGITLSREQWASREERLLYVIHAEQNLCSLFKKGEVEWVCTTLAPCFSCLKLLEAHGVKRVIYLHDYQREKYQELTKYVNIKVEKAQYELNAISAEIRLVSAEILSQSEGDSPFRD